MASNSEKINTWFQRFAHRMNIAVPGVIAETATEYFKESFTRKNWDNRPWQETKKTVNRGSLMVRSGQLLNSIRPALISAPKVTISAGSSKVPYARVHNEGAMISRAARSETFKRNRIGKGKNTGRFKKGTTASQGFTFKAFTYKMPQRQYMGHSAILNKRIIQRIKTIFNNK
ncbi:MAG: phage virion morphogenesis protein [Daejeonella sp.]